MTSKDAWFVNHEIIAKYQFSDYPRFGVGGDIARSMRFSFLKIFNII
jgi:hypothetical protein